MSGSEKSECYKSNSEVTQAAPFKNPALMTGFFVSVNQTGVERMTENNLAGLLLAWYEQHGRELPWRVKGGAHPDPYVILVSELMLQQTTVKTVIPYFHRFMKRFPTVKDLAEATQEEVYFYWQGLGYYTRARSLHATARLVMEKFNGRFPEKREDVLKLKGIGPYTVASFLALAFNQPETVVDGNVIRVISRLFRLTEPVSEILPQIREKAAGLTDRTRPADYASAIMDLGAMICTPKNPQCLLCPWQEHCLSKTDPELEEIPRRGKPAKKVKNGYVYLLSNRNGEIFIRKRTEKGLLSGLYEFPWSDGAQLFPAAKDTGCEVSHTFTHFKLILKICLLQQENCPEAGMFIRPKNLSAYPVSTLMKKVYQAALKNVF